MQRVKSFLHLGRVMTGLGIDLARFLGASLRSRTALAAENLFLRKQLALSRERHMSTHLRSSQHETKSINSGWPHDESDSHDMRFREGRPRKQFTPRKGSDRILSV
jgi:hypothetical protein